MLVTTVPALILNASASNGFVTVFSTLPLQQPLAMHSTEHDTLCVEERLVLLVACTTVHSAMYLHTPLIAPTAKNHSRLQNRGIWQKPAAVSDAFTASIFS